VSARQTNVAVGAVVCAALLTLVTIGWTVRVSPRTHFGAASAGPGNPTSERLRLGERIYREGVLPSGAPLRAHHEGGGDVAGALAACAQCHRRSGMGSFEGNRVIPPVAGRFLFQPRAHRAADLDEHHSRGPDFAHAAGRDRPRPPYTRETLVRALRDGIDAAGRPLDLLMPRFALDDADAEILADYLTQLSDRWSPGVSADEIHLATVIAPGVDPRRRQALLDVLGAWISVRNASTRLGALRDRAYPGSVQAAHRVWRLDVWDLAGPPETWMAQLEDFAGHDPPFALLSGLGDGEWAPVHGFCETHGVPCWFPTVDLPVAAADDFYSVYFNGGVELEARLIAQHLTTRRVLQVRGTDRAAAGGAAALAHALGAGARVEERVLATRETAALVGAIDDVGPDDALVLWLRPRDLARLADITPPRGAVYVSATLGGTELPPAWRAQARLADPFELPELRRAGLARFHAWLQMRGLPLVDERVQSDAYLACTLLAEKLDDMLETITRDHLLERAEAFIGARPGIYHRLSLGPSQRIASKGGYITRFSPDGMLIADGGWRVP
jgi:hypothetical protein